MLAEAYQILETERCPKCGLPRYICQNSSNDILFRVDEGTCYASAAVEEHDRRGLNSRKKSDGTYSEAPAGIFAIPVPRALSGADLGTFRAPFYEEEAAIRATLEEEYAAVRTV